MNQCPTTTFFVMLMPILHQKVLRRRINSFRIVSPWNYFTSSKRDFNSVGFSVSTILYQISLYLGSIDQGSKNQGGRMRITDKVCDTGIDLTMFMCMLQRTRIYYSGIEIPFSNKVIQAYKYI